MTEEAELHITAAQLGCSCLQQCLQVRPSAPPGFPEATLQLLHGALPTHAAHDMGKSDFKVKRRGAWRCGLCVFTPRSLEPIIVDSKRVLRPGDSLGAERDSPLADARVAAVEGPLA